MSTSARATLLRSSGILFGVALPALAQQEVGEIRELEKIEVTGSNIRRTDGDSALPVQIVTREEIERSGALTAADIMSHVSANLIGRTDVPFNTSVGYSQAGLSSANLRGLGDGSTLVLLNGRRVANYAANGGAVNLNFIPVAAIDRIEILKDGASAIYGADAMAGVINFILRKDFGGRNGRSTTPKRNMAVVPSGRPPSKPAMATSRSLTWTSPIVPLPSQWVVLAFD